MRGRLERKHSVSPEAADDLAEHTLGPRHAQASPWRIAPVYIPGTAPESRYGRYAMADRPRIVDTSERQHVARSCPLLQRR